MELGLIRGLCGGQVEKWWRVKPLGEWEEVEVESVVL